MKHSDKIKGVVFKTWDVFANINLIFGSMMWVTAIVVAYLSDNDNITGFVEVLIRITFGCFLVCLVNMVIMLVITVIFGLYYFCLKYFD